MMKSGLKLSDVSENESNMNLCNEGSLCPVDNCMTAIRGTYYIHPP